MSVEWLVFRGDEVHQLNHNEYVRVETHVGEYNYYIPRRSWSRVVQDAVIGMEFENIQENEVPAKYRAQALLLS